MICEAVSSFTLVNGMGNPITLVSKVFLVLVVKFELKAPVTFLRASFYWRLCDQALFEKLYKLT